MEKFIWLIVAYFLGSIPFSYLFGKIFKHQDLRKLGSGNLGGTNAFRVFGKPIGMAVSILDVTKSGLLVFLMLHTSVFAGSELFPAMYYGLASVLGHVYPVWFKFKGGKGVATSFGLLLAYDWRLAIVMFIVFMGTQIITRYVSVSSCLAAVVMLFTVIIRYFTYQQDIHLIIVTFFAVVIILYSHRSNFKRLKAGTENRVKWLDPLDRWFSKKKTS